MNPGQPCSERWLSESATPWPESGRGERVGHPSVGGDVPQDMVEQVHLRTKGNALFVSELLKLLEANRLDETQGWQFAIPQEIRGVIGRRFDRLSDECNRVLTIASVIGREFDFDLLSRVTDSSDDDLLDVVDEALVARVIEGAAGGTERYQFTHALIQQTLSEELSPSRNVRLHARIGQALEAFYGDEVEAHADQLAYHFTQAETVLGAKKLVRYSIAAGERAISSYAYEDALGHFQKALAAVEGSSASMDQGVDAQTAKILFGLGRAQAATFVIAQAQEAVDTLIRAFDAFVALGDTEHAVAVASYPHTLRSFSFGTAALTARALELAPPDSLEAGHLLSRHAHAIFWESNDYENAQRILDRAIAIARQERDSALEVNALFSYASMHWAQGEIRKAVEKVLPAIELGQSLGDLQALAQARSLYSNALMTLGHGDEAQIHATVGLEVAERLHNSEFLVRSLEYNVSLSMLRGE